jgi:hypothetical protein
MKQVASLIKVLGPPEALRKAFYQTFVGSLIGTAVYAMGLFAIYFVVEALAYSFAKDALQAFRDDLGVFWFWVIQASLPASILFFVVLPAGWRARRERRLKAMAIGGVPEPEYFRLKPYSAADHDVFKRLDGADDEILDWLKSTKSSLLYLSGASGVGKSSLLSAGVLPKLREASWEVVKLRTFGNAVEQMRTALLDARSVFKRRPPDTLSAPELLKKAAEVRVKEHTAPLLLVIDQFEEFLILHDEAGRRAFTALLNDLAKSPIDGLRVLLVFRSDYSPLVFKLGLPSLASGENWYELAPYYRSEAASFLQGSRCELSAQSLDALFRGLDRIEEAPGLYRPITLNMIGLVLKSMGGTLRGDPSKLIQTYLMNSLKTSISRDFVKTLLAEMITDAGTKAPHSEAELADKTKFERWQVQATLADLDQRGLVRPLDEARTVWEIAHDFLARMIGQLIGRLKPSLMERVRPLVAPVVLLGWVVVFVMALPFWQVSQQRTAERTLREKCGLILKKAEPQGISVDVSQLHGCELTDAARLLEQLDELTEVTIQNDRRITSLEPLKGLTKLSSLHINRTVGITSLEPLRGLTELSSLDVSGATFVTRLSKQLMSMSEVTLELDRDVPYFPPGVRPALEPSLVHGPSFSIANIEIPGITSLEPLKGLTNLSELNLANNARITTLEPLKGLTKLTRLDLTDDTGITSLEPLKALTNLSWLSLGATGVTSLEPLKELTKLSSLYLNHATGITSLEPLRRLTNLSSLNLDDATGITSLEPLKGLTNLSSLDLSRATGITSLEPLKGLTNLSSLDLSGATGITSLKPLKGMKVRVTASPELFNTLSSK